MIEVTVRFDASAERSPVQVVLYNHSTLTPAAARSARATEAPGANVTVSDGKRAYRVTDAGTRRVAP